MPARAPARTQAATNSGATILPIWCSIEDREQSDGHAGAKLRLDRCQGVRAELAAPTMVIGWGAVVITLLGSVAMAACRSMVV